MNITLQSLELLNFKGIKSLSIYFGQETSISGDNGTGKTTIKDAFLWLLFGKDSTGKEKFGIKTRTPDGKETPRINHSVGGTLIVDGKTVELERIYKEKWVTKRGTAQEELSTHETLYLVDGVPHKASEYQEFVASICNENLFRLLTSPTYFTSLKWEDQRRFLSLMAGEVSDESIAEQRIDFGTLLKNLAGKDFKSFKEKISYEKKNLKKQLDEIPARIDEANRTLPKVEDWITLANALNARNEEIKAIDIQIADRSKLIKSISDEKIGIQRKISAAKERQSTIRLEESVKAGKEKNDLQAELSSVDNKIALCNQTIASSSQFVESYSKEIKELQAQKNDLIIEYNAIQKEELPPFDESEFNCPACGQCLPCNDIEGKKQEIISNFNKDKAGKTARNIEKGRSKKEQIEKMESSKAAKEAELAETKSNLESLSAKRKELQEKKDKLDRDEPISIESIIASNEEYVSLSSSISEFESEMKSDKFTQDVSSETLQISKRPIQVEIDELKERLSNEKRLKEGNERIADLNTQRKNISQQVADLEQQEFVMDDFIKTKIAIIEQRVNGLFQIVKFKMYDTQVNGGEAPTCKCTIDGVPFDDLNSASKTNAGMDIINAASKFYDVYAPVIVDNRESVVKLLPCNSQIINLSVEKGVALKVEIIK